MIINGNMADGIVKTMSANQDFSDLTFVVAYENEIKPTPIDKPIVALSVKGCEIGERLTETLDTGEIKNTENRQMLTTLSVDIYLPYSKGGSAGHKIFDRIATYFLFVKDLDAAKATCGNTDYDKNSEALVLKTQFVFKHIINS